MHSSGQFLKGQRIRLTSSYWEAERGVYQVIYVYRNGWLGVVSPTSGRQFDVPAHICRQISPAAGNEQRGKTKG